ncbi:hypothetical protein ACLOJK_032746 [Asimina triloba]
MHTGSNPYDGGLTSKSVGFLRIFQARLGSPWERKLAAAAATATAASSALLPKSTAPTAALDAASHRFYLAVSRRWTSSSSSSLNSWAEPPSENRKLDKKQNHRPSAVIDALHDRKLPPELRARRFDAIRTDETAKIIEDTLDYKAIMTDPHPPTDVGATSCYIQSPSCRRRHQSPFFRRVSFGLFKTHQSGIRAVDRPPPLLEKTLPKSQPLPPPEKKIDPVKQILNLDRDVIPVVLDELDHPTGSSPELGTSTVRWRRSTVLSGTPTEHCADFFGTQAPRQQHSKRTVSATSAAQ